jgi:hypothetical protein
MAGAASFPQLGPGPDELQEAQGSGIGQGRCQMTELRITKSRPRAAGAPGASPETALRRLGAICLLIGLTGLGACVLWTVGAAAADQFFRAYLLGFLFCGSIAIGCLGLLMMSHLTGGAWGLVPRRILEAAARSLPFLLVLLVPIFFGLRWLFAFARPEEVAHSEVLQHQRLYLNAPFYVLRSLCGSRSRIF